MYRKKFLLQIACGLAMILVSSISFKGTACAEGWIGLQVQDLTPEMREVLEISDGGVIIAGVAKGSPADKAGLKSGDVILQVNRKIMKNARQLALLVGSLPADKRALFLIDRGGVNQFVMVAVGTKLPSGSKLSKDQLQLVQRQGYPDDFTIVIMDDENIKNKIRRIENWSYYDSKEAFVFVDSELKGKTTVEDIPVRSAFAKVYRPEQFESQMNWAEVARLIPEAQRNRDFMFAKDQTEYYPVALGGIKLGFERGQLVYVDTTPPIEEGAGEWPEDKL